MSKRMLTVVLTVLCWTGCSGHDAQRREAPDLPTATVRVQTLEFVSAPLLEELSGTIRAKHRATLEARIPGRIQEMLAVPGQTVRAGQLLVRLDLEEFRAKLEQAQAVRQQTDIDLQRTTALIAREAATPAELDAVTARARVAAAAVEEAQTMLSRAEILAPFDGVVTRKLADAGDLAVPGKPLVELEDPKLLRAEVDVAESLIDRIATGQKIEVRVSTLDAALRASVTEIAPSADPASRTFVVKLDLPPTPGLRAGSFVRVAVPVGETQTLLVPRAAVIQRGQLEFVFVDIENRAELRLVRTGKLQTDRVELLSGVAAGERVVVDGMTGLRDGQTLTVEP